MYTTYIFFIKQFIYFYILFSFITSSFLAEHVFQVFISCNNLFSHFYLSASFCQCLLVHNLFSTSCILLYTVFLENLTPFYHNQQDIKARKTKKKKMRITLFNPVLNKDLNTYIKFRYSINKIKYLYQQVLY